MEARAEQTESGAHRLEPPPRPPRIPPGDRGEIGAVNAQLARLASRAVHPGGKSMNVFTTIARHRKLFRPWLRLVKQLATAGELELVDTELTILRTAYNCDCAYVWDHHVVVGGRAGLAPALIERLRQEAPREGLSQHQVTLVQAADELHADRVIHERTWAELRGRLSDNQLIELCMLVGHYEMVSMTLRSLRVVPDVT